MVNLSSGIYSYAGMKIPYIRIVLMLNNNKPSGFSARLIKNANE